MSFGTTRRSSHLFETVLLGTLVPDAYKGLWTGVTKWDDAKVTEALDNFKRMLGYVNEDHAALTWDQANDLVISGKAGMQDIASTQKALADACKNAGV